MNFSGEPNAHVLCHCKDCKKISGSMYSTNVVVPEDNFKLISGIFLPCISQNFLFLTYYPRLAEDLFEDR